MHARARGSLTTSERAHLELAHRADKRESLARMAGSLAHDFNNILLAIGTNAEFALFDCDPRSAMYDSLQDILAATKRAASQCERLLAYSGRGRFVLSNVHLDATLRALTAELRAELPAGIELELDIVGEQLPPLEGDPVQLRQLLRALVNNAVEAMGSEGGTVGLRLGLAQLFDPHASEPSGPAGGSLATGNYLQLELTDTGPGMDADTLARAFDPFFTTHNTGRGLGLAAAAGVVQAHGGHIELYSQPGQGTRVEILLPHTDVSGGDVREDALPAIAPAPDTNKDGWRGEGTVLLVDDDAQARSAARLMLERLGFEVREAVDGLDTLDEHARSGEQLRCVLLDLTMPRMNGHECLAELRAREPQLPVLVCSGYSERELDARAEPSRPDAFVAKPYSLEGLRDALDAALSD